MWSCIESGGCGAGGEGGGGGGAAPCARGKHSATLLGGRLYVLGGRGAGAGGSLPLRDFWRYTLATGEWERLPMAGEAPPALQEHAAVAHRQRLYVFGGEAAASSCETPLWIYDTETQIWRKVPGQVQQSAALRRRRAARGARGGAAGAAGQGAAGAAGGPGGRRGHSAHGLKDCLLIYGGYMDLRGTTNELWAFHYETESWHAVRTARAGPARHRHAAALHDNRLYVHGGQSDLRDCGDLWCYDTMSRVWAQVRPAARPAPGARSGHAGLRAGGHLYIFGGEAGGHPTNELWRFHFATETWEQIAPSASWPAPRVDCCALLVSRPPAPAARASPPARPVAPAPRPAPPAGLLRELTRLSSLHRRGGRDVRCAYRVLAADPERNSSESLAPISKSRYAVDERQPADGDEAPAPGDLAEQRPGRRDIAREPISVPDFADMVLPTPVLSPVEATKLVYLDSDEEGGEGEPQRPAAARVARVEVLPKSASVRFTRRSSGRGSGSEEEAELSTSDYASAERVGRAPAGFCNPHYLGPDVRALAAAAAATPDSGVGVAAGDLELRDLRPAAPAPAPARSRAASPPLHLLLLGGKEPPHPALLPRRLSMWTYRLL